MDLWKDPNAETFFADMPYYTKIYLKKLNKTVEIGTKKFITELKVGLSEKNKDKKKSSKDSSRSIFLQPKHSICDK